MTTIAYKDGVIAYDSRQTRGSIISGDNVEKSTVKDGVTFILCGRLDDVSAIIKSWFGDVIDFEPQAYGLVIDKDGVLWECGFDKTMVAIKYNTSEHYAFGSGDLHAITAMDMGATAKEAVGMAIKRDVYTGGRVRTIKVKI